MKQQTMYKLGFALVYTFVMLPFSVTFFHHIATAPGDYFFLGIIPLSAAHNFTLPMFLAILEFSSINIAFLLWARTETVKRKIVLALLFVSCQSLPVVSIFYDIMAKEYSTITASSADMREDNKDRIMTLKAQIADTSADITSIREGRDRATAAVTQLIASDKADTKQFSRISGKSDRDLNSLMKKKQAMFAELIKLESSRETTAARISELSYVRQSLTSSTGRLPLFLAFLFPLSILTFARVIKPEPRPVSEHVARVHKKKKVKKSPVVELGPVIA
jgi:hypothetical protein